MKNFIITMLLAIAIAGIVVLLWRYNATRPTDEAGTRAVLETQARWQGLAKKYPVEDAK